QYPFTACGVRQRTPTAPPSLARDLAGDDGDPSVSCRARRKCSSGACVWPSDALNVRAFSGSLSQETVTIESSTMTSSHYTSASTSARIWTGSVTDFRQAFRLLWKSKRITATTLVTLALCIGATTAIFSSVYSLMLRPLPYQQPERIVELYSSAVKAGLDHMPANVPFYIDYSQNASSYESLGLWTFFYGLVGEKASVVRMPGARMTAEIFNILRIQPVLGTFFTKDQNKPGADKVIVLTQSYW